MQKARGQPGRTLAFHCL